MNGKYIPVGMEIIEFETEDIITNSLTNSDSEYDESDNDGENDV